MRLLITGGAGFIGSHLAKRALELGYEVHVVDNLSRGRRENVPPNAPLHLVDVAGPGIEDVIDHLLPEVIVHLAAQMNVRVSVTQPVLDAQINVLGTLRLLQAAHKARVKTFIQASTGGAIYGDCARVPTPESAARLPKSPYGVSKMCAEAYLDYFSQQGGARSLSLRFANVYGPRQSSLGDAGVVGIFARAMLKNQAPCVFGDGLQTRDYIYVADVVDAIIAAIHTPGAQGAFNIGSGQETSLIKLIAHLRAPSQYEGPITHSAPRPGEQRRSCLSCAKAARTLLWQPKTPLAQGLASTVAWVQTQLQAAPSA